jgi:hypothetical protein
MSLAIIVTSCARETATQFSEEHSRRIQAAYCTNDVRSAERSLLEDLRTVDGFESNHLKGMDYDALRATDHERLFLIYRKTHETNKMEAEFQYSIDCIARSSRRWGGPPPPVMTYDEFAQKIEFVEHDLDVRWKTNVESFK